MTVSVHGTPVPSRRHDSPNPSFHGRTRTSPVSSRLTSPSPVRRSVSRDSAPGAASAAYRVALPREVFTGRSAEAGLDLTLSLSQSVTKTQMSHLETSNADSAQSKDVWNENLEFSMSSADCLLSADCLQNPNEPFRDF